MSGTRLGCRLEKTLGRLLTSSGIISEAALNSLLQIARAPNARLVFTNNPALDSSSEPTDASSITHWKPVHRGGKLHVKPPVLSSLGRDHVEGVASVGRLGDLPSRVRQVHGTGVCLGDGGPRLGGALRVVGAEDDLVVFKVDHAELGALDLGVLQPADVRVGPDLAADHVPALGGQGPGQGQPVALSPAVSFEDEGGAQDRQVRLDNAGGDTLDPVYPWREQLVTLTVWILEAVRVDVWAESVDGDGALHGGRIDGDEGVLVVGGELKGPIDVRSVVPARDRLPGAYLDV
jgi:hypothetical protein